MKWLFLSSTIVMCLGLILWIYFLMQHYKNLRRKGIRVSYKSLIWDTALIMLVPIAIIKGGEGIVWILHEPMDSILTSLTVLLGGMVIYSFIKKKSVIFIR